MCLTPYAASGEPPRMEGKIAVLEVPEAAFPWGRAAVPTSSHQSHQLQFLPFRARNKRNACCLISGSPSCCCSCHADQEELGAVTEITSPLPLI